MHSAVKGCFKDRNPKFKETIDKLIALGADLTVKNGHEETAEQYALVKLLDSYKYGFKDYDTLAENFDSCEECVKKRKKYKRENALPLDDFWSPFVTVFSECNECFQNVKDKLQCYHSTW